MHDQDGLSCLLREPSTNNHYQDGDSALSNVQEISLEGWKSETGDNQVGKDTEACSEQISLLIQQEGR